MTVSVLAAIKIVLKATDIGFCGIQLHYKVFIILLCAISAKDKRNVQESEAKQMRSFVLSFHEQYCLTSVLTVSETSKVSQHRTGRIIFPESIFM